MPIAHLSPTALHCKIQKTSQCLHDFYCCYSLAGALQGFICARCLGYLQVSAQEPTSHSLCSLPLCHFYTVDCDEHELSAFCARCGTAVSATLSEAAISPSLLLPMLDGRDAQSQGKALFILLYYTLNRLNGGKPINAENPRFSSIVGLNRATY